MPSHLLMNDEEGSVTTIVVHRSAETCAVFGEFEWLRADEALLTSCLETSEQG
jgi:hypothetical protein